MKVTQMPPIHAANLLVNSGNTAYGVAYNSLQHLHIDRKTYIFRYSQVFSQNVYFCDCLHETQWAFICLHVFAATGSVKFGERWCLDFRDREGMNTHFVCANVMSLQHNLSNA